MYRKTILFFAILLFAVTTVFSVNASAFNLPDTGQTLCYDEARNLLTCPVAGEPLAQDGSYDINPLSYRDNGDGTITDMNTGLMWQKEDAGEHHYYKAFGVYDPTDNPTSQNICSEQGTGGYSDWRLPSKKELLTIVNFGITDRFSPAIDAEYFPDTATSFYFTSTRFQYTSFLAPFCLSFYSGTLGDYGYSPYSFVRCVRGGEFPNQSLEDNGNNTVTDRATGLKWQQEEVGQMLWADSLEYCEDLSLAGLSHWRLPNIKELESITDDTTYDPSINTDFFPNAYSSFYWTSSPVSGNSNDTISSLVVKFKYGGTSSDLNSNLNYVRCVHSTIEDADGDGVGDDVDNCPDIANAEQADCDNDNIGDACDPDTVDIDGDGIDDVCDNCIDAYEPNDYSIEAAVITLGTPQSHSICPVGDEDWIKFTLTEFSSVVIEVTGYSGEIYISLYDESLTRIDSAYGIPEFFEIPKIVLDECDSLPSGLYYLRVEEYGNNGVIDSYDIHVTGTQIIIEDDDSDGVRNECDNCPNDINNDEDSDGVCGDVDNCPNAANFNQVDTDSDGIGDICDNCLMMANPNQENTDSDNIGNACDNCPFVANPNQKNVDNETETGTEILGDVCDADTIYGTVTGDVPENLVIQFYSCGIANPIDVEVSSNGYYASGGLENGRTYSILPPPDGYTFDPSLKNVSIPEDSGTSHDFTSNNTCDTVDRFLDNGDGTVTDCRTNLVWLQNANCFGNQDWNSAISFAARLSDKECGLSDDSMEGDWRVPTKEELQGIGTDPPETWTAGYPSVTWTKPGSPFVAILTGQYWSSTEYNTSIVWHARMTNGFTGYDVKDNGKRVWPVRDPY